MYINSGTRTASINMLRLSFYTTIGPIYIISIFITPQLASNIWAIALKSLLRLFPKSKQITSSAIIRFTICRYSFIDLSVKPFCKLQLNNSKFTKYQGAQMFANMLLHHLWPRLVGPAEDKICCWIWVQSHNQCVKAKSGKSWETNQTKLPDFSVYTYIVF